MQGQGQGQGQAQGQGQESQGSLWQARQAVLTLLACYLRTSPIVQRTAVLKWNVVAALFSLLWEERTQQPALDMVCCAVLCCLSVCVCLSVCMYVCLSLRVPVCLPTSHHGRNMPADAACSDLEPAFVHLHSGH